MKRIKEYFDAWVIFRRGIFCGFVLFGLLSTNCVSPTGKYIFIESH